MFRSPWRELLFSLKVFSASMFALYVAMRLGLERPYWAMMTVYIVAQPFSGMAMAKGVSRLAGTLAGGIASLMILGSLQPVPELTILALALWLGGCLWLSLLETSVFSYAFMLSGYTALFITLPMLNSPTGLFQYVLSRVLEIGLGVSAYLLVDLLFWPRTTGDVLIDALQRWYRMASGWQCALLSGELPAHDKTRLPLLGLLRQIHDWRQHALRDSGRLRGHAALLLDLQCALQEQFTLTVSIEDRLHALRDSGITLDGPQQQLLRDSRQAILLMQHDLPLPRLHQLIERLQATPAAMPEQDPTLPGSLARLLPALLQSQQRSQELRRLLYRAPLRRRSANRLGSWRDPWQAASAAMVAIVSVLVTSTFWYVSGWQYGYVAVMMAGVSCSLFASMDNPTRPARGFFIYSLWSLPIGLTYLYGILPLMPDFGGLLLALAPCLLFLGFLVAQPAWMPTVTPLLLGTLVVLSINNQHSPGFLASLEAAISQQIGMGVPLLMQGLLRRLGSDQVRDRLLAAMQQQVVRSASGVDLNRAEAESRHLELMHGILQRAGQQMGELTQRCGALLRLTLLLGVITPQQASLLPHARKAVRTAQQALADYFAQPLSRQTLADLLAVREQWQDAALQAAQPAGAVSQPLRDRLTGVILSLELYASALARPRTTGELHD